MTEPETPSTAARGVNRTKLILLAVLFMLPILGSTLLYSTGWRPSGSVNYGELVSPARPIMDSALTRLDGSAARFSQLQGKWTMLYFGSAECIDICTQTLYNMRQVHLAQGKDSHRIQRVFVVTDSAALDLLRYTLKDYPGMDVYIGPKENVDVLARQFALKSGSPLDGLHRIYVVDPLGNFMMSYPADSDPSKMRKDFVRLLKVSQIG